MTAALGVRLSGEGLAPSLVGSKGAALDRLVGLAAPVPPTGVVTTESYRTFVSQPVISTFLDTLRSTPVPPPADHAAARAHVDEVFLSVPLPSTIADAVDRLVVDVAGEERVAVRSSATAEDLGQASFAGQYESYLDVEPDDAHDAVRRVWASMWYPSPRSYRWFHGIGEDDLAMAVVVMRMLDPSIAGVMFTVDPGGKPNAVRLEVVEGLGEQLVSGAVTPDAHVLDRDDLEAHFGAIAAPLAGLAREALRLEAALGEPQDIEFAVHHDELFLVQARPITTSSDDTDRNDGFDFSCGIDTTYTTAGVTEMLPGVLPPLLWGVDSWLVENGFRSLFEMLGGGAEELTDGHALIGRFGGRAALNLDAMRAAATSIPGGSPEELEQQYFGAVVKTDEDNRRADQALQRAGASRARQGVRVLRARRRAAQESEIAIQTVHRLVDREPDVTGLDDMELVAYWNRLLHVAQQIVAAEIAVAAMASASYRSVEVFLARYLDAAAASEAAQELTTTDAAQRHARVALGVEPVVAQLKADPRLREAAVQDWNETRSRLERNDRGKALVRQMLTAWRRAGSTGILAGPTWEEAPHLAWMVVYQELVRPDAARPAPRAARRVDLERRLTRDATWRAARWATMQVFDVRRRFFRRQTSEAAEFLERRELTKAACLQLGGVLRRCHLEFGRRLVAGNRLEVAADIQYIGIDEVEAIFDGRGPTLQTVARRRRFNREANQSPALPPVWTGLPPAVSGEVVGERIEGWSASPGRYEGLARVVHSPASTEFVRGEVLVAATTDASWMPLFMAAGAIVVEQGGPLSHAAILARELGVPTVVNVPGLIARLERESGTVQMVVDGTHGVVTFHTDAPDEAQPPTLASASPVAGTDAPATERERASVGAVHTAGYAPARVPHPRWDDTSTPMNVFVAGLMGAGALMSIIVGLTESVSSTQGRARLRRRAQPIALTTADGAVDGFDAVAASPTGIRDRRDYGIAAAALLVFGAAILARSSDLYFEGSVGSVGWALTATGAVTLLAGGCLAGAAVVAWPDVPIQVRRSAPGYPPNSRSLWSSVPHGARVAIAVMTSLVLVGAVFVAFALDWVLEIDRPIYFEWLHAGRAVDRWGPDWFNEFGRLPFLIVIPVAVFLIAFLRCRVVAIAYPLTIAVGGAIFLTLNWTVHRLRPPFSAHAGQHTSYPGGHSIQVALILLSLPLVVWLLTRNRVARVVGTIIPVGVWAITEIDTIRTGGHWPIDQTAGLLIAACLLTILYSVALDAIRHESCHGAPLKD
jgi:pyruvate,water dikinase